MIKTTTFSQAMRACLSFRKDRLRFGLVCFFVTLLLILPEFGWGQTASIDYPYQRQSVVSGAQLPVRVRVTPPVGFSITEVSLTRNSGGGSTTAVIGTSTTPSSSTNTFTIPWSVSLTQSGGGGFLELATRATCSNGVSTSVLTSTKLVNVIAENSCNTGANVKRFYVQAGASTATTAGLGESPTNPSGSFNKIINNGVNGLRPLPGDIIYVMNGIDAGSGPQSYTRVDASTSIDLFAVIRTGTPGCPITITNFEGTPKLKATGTTNNAIFIPPGISYININGLEIEGLYTDAQLATTLPLALTQNGSCRDDGTLRPGTPSFAFNGSGITIDGRNSAGANPHHINITNNKIHNCSGGGIGAIEADYVKIENNTIYNNAWYTIYGASGISVFHPWNYDNNTTEYRNLIRNNKCYGNRLYVKWNSGCKITDGNGIIIDDFLNSQSSSTIQGQRYTGRTLVANNVSFNNGGSGIHTFKGLNTDIINNSAYLNSQSQGPDTPVGDIHAQSSEDVTIANNIIMPIAGEKTFTTSTGNSRVTYNSNLYLVDNPATQVPANTANVTVTANQILAPSSATAVFTNPGTDPATADFTLKAGSPAINAGSSSYLAAVPVDMAGVSRPQGSGVDAGAYEFQGTPLTISQQPASGSSVCVGAAVTALVTISGSVERYQWYKNGAALTGVSSATTATLTLSNVTTADAGSYSVVATGFNSVTSTAFNLTVNALPTVSISPQNGVVTAANPSLILNATASVADLRWSDNSTNTTLVVSAGGLYSVTATSPEGCTASASATVSYDQSAPVATLTPSSATLTCANPSVTLTAGGGSSYAFSAGAAQIGTTNQAVVTQGGTYSVVVSGTNGNTAIATSTVDLDQTPPSVSITANPGLTVATGTSVTLMASGANTYRWSNGASTTAITVTTANTYSVTGTAPNGCTATAQETVAFVAPPTVSMAFPQYFSSFISGTTMNIRVNATTLAGTTITKVEYYSSISFGEFSKIGEVTAPPYSMNYTFPAVPAAGQSRQFRAVVTNSAGTTAIQGNNNTSVTVYPPAYTSTRNWYVSASASSANTAGTEALPFNTIQKAADRVAPGDNVYVMAGTYTGSGLSVVQIQRTGLPDKWITFKPYQNDKPIIQLGNNNFNGFNVLSAGAYIRIEGFEVIGNNANITLADARQQPGACEGPNPTATPIAKFNGNGISISGSTVGGNLRPHHVVIANNSVHDCAGGGIGAGQADYLTFEDNTVYNNSWYTVYGTSGLNIINAWNFDNSTATKIIFRRNKSFNNKLLIAWNIGGTGTNCKFYDGNGIILDNNNAAKNSLGAYTGRFLIENNLSYQNGGRGINVNYSDNADIINNTVYQNGASNGGPGVGIESEIIAQGGNSLNIYNNIFFGRTGEKTIDINTSNTNVSHNNNLVFQNGGTGSPYFTGGQNITGQDPQFVDAANGDFQLSSASPAVNAGSSAPGQYGAKDILGINRPQGSGVDIGAYELQGTPVVISGQPASSSAVCAGASVSVSVAVDGPVKSYQWYKDGAILTGVASATTAALSLAEVTVAQQGNYLVVVTGFNQVTSNKFALTVNPLPQVGLLNNGPLTCAKTSVMLTANSTTTGSYGFSGPGGVLSGQDNTASVSQPGVYTVVLTDANGCSATTTTSVTQNITPPSLSVNNTGPLTCAKISVTVGSAATAGVTYQWNGPADFTSAAAEFTTGTTGLYALTVTGPNGCTAASSTTVQFVNDLAAPTLLTQSGQASLTAPQYSGNVTLVAAGCAGTLNWSGPGNTSGTGNTILVPTAQTGTLVYSAICQLGSCTSQPTIATIRVVAAPLTLTTPIFDCATGQLSLRTSGGNGRAVEYQIASITDGWSSQSAYVLDDKDRKTKKSLKIRVRQRQADGSSWDENEIEFTLPGCGAGARLSAGEIQELPLQVTLLGNPVQAQQVRAQVRGALGQPLVIDLITLQGRAVDQQRIEQAQLVQEVELQAGTLPGVYLLRISTPTQTQTVRVLRAQ